MNKSTVSKKSYSFSLMVISLYKELVNDSQEYVLSKQLLKSGTAIGALIREAEHAQSKKDFLNKMNIALKEANETVYWIELLRDSDQITKEKFLALNNPATELLKMLVSIVKTTKRNLDI